MGAFRTGYREGADLPAARSPVRHLIRSLSSFLIETARDEGLDGSERLRLVFAGDRERDARSLGGREQQDSEDALAVDFLTVLLDLHRRAKAARRLDQFWRRASGAGRAGAG